MTPTSALSVPRTTRVAPTITLYGPYDCPNCDKAMKLFDRNGIEYQKVNLEQGDENHQYVTQELGYQQAPVIVVEIEKKHIIHWGGHRMDMLMAVVRLCTKGIDPHGEDLSAGLS